MNQQFLRMQQLAGIKPAKEDYNEVIDILVELHLHTNYYSKGILKENINEGIIDSLKNKFKDLKPQSKKFIQNTISDIKKKANPVNFLKDLASLPKFSSTSEFVRAYQIAKTLSSKKNINEADRGSFTSLDQLKELQPGDTFVWNGELMPDATYNGEKIYQGKYAKGKKGKELTGLTPGETFILLEPVEFEQYSYPATIALKQKEYTSAGGPYMWFRKLFDKYPWIKTASTALVASMAIVSVGAGVANPTIALVVDDVDVEGVYGPSGGLAPEDMQGVLSDIPDDAKEEFKADASEIPSSGGAPDVDDNKVIDSIEGNKVNTQGVDFSDTADSATTAQTYETGEGDLSPEQVDKAADELVKKTLDDLNSKLKNSEGEKIDKINLEIDYGSSVSHNQGDDSNVSNDGGDLNAKRLDSSEKVAKAAAEKIEKIVKNTYGDNVDVEISYKKVDTSSGIDDQTTQKAKDFLETQASFQSVKSDVETSPDGEPIKLLYYQFLAEPDKLGPDSVGGGGDKGETKKEKDKEKDKEPTPPPPVGGEGGVDIISKLNRNGQIAYLLSRTSPKLNLFAAAEKEVGSLSDNDLKKVIDSEQSSDTMKKLARLVPNLRKSPDTLLKKFSSATGIKLQPRAKAIATRPGKDTQAQLQKTQENKIMLSSLLQEALIDDVFNELGVTDDVIKANKIELLALLGSMYASAGDNTLSILDTKELSDADKAKLKGLGFQPQAGGNYVFLGAGETKASYFDKLQNKTKTQPDVNRVTQAIGKDVAFKRFLGKLDNKNELSSFILALFLYKDTKGKVLFDPKQTFATDTGKVRAAMFGLNNRIPDTLTEEEDDLIRKFPDVQAAYTYIGKSSTLRSLLQNINTIEEFYQLVLRSILPHINPKFKTKDGVGELKSAIALAANKSKEFQDILNKKKTK
jgi:hypothetical protein